MSLDGEDQETQPDEFLQEDALAIQMAPSPVESISTRRKTAAVFLGVFYGGSLINGVDQGLQHALRTEDYVLAAWPLIESAINIACGGLAAFLAAYCGRSKMCGILAGGILAGLGLAIGLLFFESDEMMRVQVTSILVLTAGGLFAPVGTKLPISAEDVAEGRLFGISWKHWLWLFIPWQLMIAGAVAAAYPISLTMEASPRWTRIAWDIVRAPAYVGMIAYGSFRAFAALRADNQLSRGQAAMRFVWWLALFPVVVNLLRLAGW